MRYLILLYSLIVLFPLAAQQDGVTVQCPVVKIEVERLADLNIPRYGHSVLLLNGEPTVIGGHTTNFVPTPTLEYYKDGKWHMVQTAFIHDDGFAVQLTSGKVLIGGGHEKNMGIGQSYEVELYDPETLTSEGFASLDTKRAMASALALDDGSVVITGNWHHEDAIEIYDGKNSFLIVKEVSMGRCTPFILQTAKDDAIIIGASDTVGRQITHQVVDRLHGEPYHVPLFETWKLIQGFVLWPSSCCFIGDEAKGDYSYLLPVTDDAGQVAIARVTNGEFSLLVTDVPIPKSCQWGEITYCPSLFTDRKCQRAYLMGYDFCLIETSELSRLYVVAIDYSAEPARLTFCYTDPLTDIDPTVPVLTPDGDLMLTGGVHERSYFKPSVATWLIHLNPRTQAATTGLPLWRCLLFFLAIVALATWLILLYRHRKRNYVEVSTAVSTEVEDSIATSTPVEDILEDLGSSDGNAELMRRLIQMMEEERPFLNPDLKVTDIAKALGTNRVVLSNCIKSHNNCTFPQFVNTYRVKFAQQMLSSSPDIKLTEVWTAAGFSSESSFYRIFKSITGTTPNDWKTTNS